MATFSPDFIPLHEEEIARHLTLWEYLRNDLLKLTKPLSSAALDLRVRDEERSVREILRHVASADWWYVSRLVKGLEKAYPEITERKPRDTFKRLDAIRAMALECLSHMPPEARERVYVPTHYAKYKDEKWVYRKVLRRISRDTAHVKIGSGVRFRPWMHSAPPNAPHARSGEGSEIYIQHVVYDG